MDYNQRMAYRVIHVIATALLLLLAIPALAADPKGKTNYYIILYYCATQT